MASSRICPLFAVFAGVLAISGSFPGAQAQDEVPPPAGSTLTWNRLIIKFRPADLDPSRAEYLERLFRDTGVTLTYVRPMAGGAHLFQISRPRGDAELESVLERLSKHPDIQYVEPDRRFHHMK